MRWAGYVARTGGGEVCTGIWWGNLNERDYLEYPGIDGRIILRWIFRKMDWGMDWIDLAQVSDRWRVLVNAVMNVRVTKNEGKFLSTLGRALLHEVIYTSAW